MSESEAKLRIEQSFKYGSEIKLGLDQLQVVVQKQNSSQGTLKRKPNFVGLHDANIVNTRWNNCCIAATKQLYGTNQNVSTIKQQLTTNKQDIFILRLIAQTSLKCSIMLKGLLQFPEQLQAKADEPAVVRVVAVCSELLTLLALAGILDTEMTNSCQQQADVAVSNDTSLVESEVIQTLHNEGRVAKHLADLAAEKLGNKGGDSSAMTAGVGLGDGCTLHLLHDSLSNRLAAKAAVARPVPAHKYTIRRSSALRSNLKTGLGNTKKTFAASRSITKQAASASTTSSKLGPHVVSATPARRKASGERPFKKAVGADKKRSRSSKTRHLEKARDRSRASVNKDGEQRERERLWRQLMPLLANQDVVLQSDEEQHQDWQATVDHLDQLIARVSVLESDVQATQQLLEDCDSHQPASTTADTPSDLDTAIEEARNMLRGIGFLPPLSAVAGSVRGGCWCGGAGTRAQGRGEPSKHTQVCLDRRKDEAAIGRGGCSYNEGDVVDSSDSVQGRYCEREEYDADASFSDCLNEVRRAREEFWAGLAVSGHIET